MSPERLLAARAALDCAMALGAEVNLAGGLEALSDALDFVGVERRQDADTVAFGMHDADRRIAEALARWCRH